MIYYTVLRNNYNYCDACFEKSIYYIYIFFSNREIKSDVLYDCILIGSTIYIRHTYTIF